MKGYDDFVSSKVLENFIKQATSVPNVPGLSQIGPSGGLENQKSLQFLCDIFEKISPTLEKILKQRVIDRDFIDQRTKALCKFNIEQGLKPADDHYQSVLGLEDHQGRVVVGPLQKDYWRTVDHKPIAPLPEFLRGPHVTLFGPPGNAKMCINAMNSYHRKLKGEPAIIEELLSSSQSVPMWGADDEDSKTPIRSDLISSGRNLSDCFTQKITVPGEEKKYFLQSDHQSMPIKRFPGLALPCVFLFFKNKPLPLHLYDFALHLFENWSNPKALVFYVPKLENEEEAQYIKLMILTAESMIQKIHPSYVLGTVRLMIVLENPRAVFRTHEIIDQLYPYFAGASLGWHDYLASAARLFKEDSQYRIPIKADPDIVIKYIKASHDLLNNVVGPRGGIKIGGMYGILPIDNDINSASFQQTLKGYFRDVITQFKRGLNGFWVAHPDFVRLGLAMVEAWKFYQNGDRTKIENLVNAIMAPEHRTELLQFIHGQDIAGLDQNHPRYARSLIVADLGVSKMKANHDFDEIRYNVFQSLQYLADWLSGNGCVALPANVGGTAVRVMDDLATAERSRWEVWHEVSHGRVSLQDFLKIAHEEMNFIRKDLSNQQKIVQVKWTPETEKWYPVAFQVMLKLMSDPNPVEFATQLLLPFTIESVRSEVDPWKHLCQLSPAFFKLPKKVEKFNTYFEKCGHAGFAHEMAKDVCTDFAKAKTLIESFSLSDINMAAAFHGDIGQSKATLDASAAAEQADVLNQEQKLKDQLLNLGEQYKTKFGMKFLISARGKSGSEILEILKTRMENSLDQELQLARQALWLITEKRLQDHPLNDFSDNLKRFQEKYKIQGAQLALCTPQDSSIQNLVLGEARSGQPVSKETYFEIASLSKTFASAFAIEYFKSKDISLNISVNQLLQQTKSTFRITSDLSFGPAEWADQVTLAHLMSHQALNMHYVNGIPADENMPKISELLTGNSTYGYVPIKVIHKPGTKFKYSGAGFMVIEHLIEALENKPIEQVTEKFIKDLGLKNFTFNPSPNSQHSEAQGHCDNMKMIKGGRKMFPSFAAGALASSESVLSFLQTLGRAYQDVNMEGPISHDTACEMLHGSDLGSLEFMGAQMGLGVFVGEAGPNRFAIHQGANDGFRCLYMSCFAGPDKGLGLVACARGELNAVHFIANLTQEFLKLMDCQGFDFNKFKMSFHHDNVIIEEVVNKGYKDLIFSAFQSADADPIQDHGPLDPLSQYNRILDAEILSCTNQRFAPAINLISPYEPVFDPTLFGPQGKVMDSWESARHNPKPSEDLVLKLKTPCQIKFVQFSTQFHLGNQVPMASLWALADQWYELISSTPLQGHAIKKILVEKHLDKKFSQIKIMTFPDGGLSRLAIYDDQLPQNEQKLFLPQAQAKSEVCSMEIPKSQKPLVLPFRVTGDSIVSVSNEHYGPIAQVISPFDPLHMFDGFESARSRVTGHREEFVLKFKAAKPVKKILFDFTYFVNNNPREVQIHGLTEKGWVELVPPTNVKAYCGNKKVFQIKSPSVCEQIKVCVIPDGGINRIEVS